MRLVGLWNKKYLADIQKNKMLFFLSEANLD